MAGSGPRCLGRGSFIRVHRRFSQNSMLVQAFQRQLEVDCGVFYTPGSEGPHQREGPGFILICGADLPEMSL